MRVLVDTSVWIDHFRNRKDALGRLLARDGVLTHPKAILELACGTPHAPRVVTPSNIVLLQPCSQATFTEVLALIERQSLFGLGCGRVDLSLLASTLITPGAELWTLGRRLCELAGRFGVAHQAILH